MKLWTEDNLVPSRWKHLVQDCRLYRHQANLYRYEILHREGGIYVDTDFQCLRSLEPLIHGLESFAVYQCDDPADRLAVNNALFGAVPGHPFLTELIENIPAHFDRELWINCGPIFFTEMVRRHPDVHLFPRKLFYPYLWNELHRRDESFPSAYAVHHWASMWLDKVGLTGVVGEPKP